jgi:orotidine-5'-phosphate decarboxylase
VGVLGVTVLTSVTAEDVREAGFADPYARDVSLLVARRAAMAAECGLDGVVCSPQEVLAVKKQLGRDFIAVTPGIRLSGKAVESDDQRRVMTPAEAVKSGADYIVVGRPIRDAADPCEAADAICREIEAVLPTGVLGDKVVT